MKRLTGYSGLLAVLLLAACIRQAYDPPPDLSAFDPKLPVTHSIALLKSINGLYDYRTGSDTTLIQDSVVVSGIVTANDQSGNLYQSIVIEDSSGAIQVLIDGYSLYASYPVGRKVYIRCAGLTLGYNSGTPVLGLGVDEQLGVRSIPGNRIDAHIVKGDVRHPVLPLWVPMEKLTASAGALDRSLINRFVRLDDVMFSDSNGARSYAQSNTATNREIRDCSGHKLALRTSNFASFAAVPLPAGGGSITGIFSVYTSGVSGAVSPQLTIRDTGDVAMYGLRCGYSGDGAAAPPLLRIDSLRRMFRGKAIRLPAVRIAGVVISDAASGNISSGLVILQDGPSGISVYLGGQVPYVPGDSLVLNLTGDSLKSYAGMLEITGVSSSAVTKSGSGRLVSPRTVSLGGLYSGFEAYEATLVRVEGASVRERGTYSGSRTLEDATGSIVLRTAGSAVFAGQPLPTGTKSFVGIATWYNSTRQLSIRNLNDVR